MKVLNLKIGSKFSQEDFKFSKTPTAKLVSDNIYLKEDNLFNAQPDSEITKGLKILKILNLQNAPLAPKEQLTPNVLIDPKIMESLNFKHFKDFKNNAPQNPEMPIDGQGKELLTFFKPSQVTKDCNHAGEVQNYNYNNKKSISNFKNIHETQNPNINSLNHINHINNIYHINHLNSINSINSKLHNKIFEGSVNMKEHLIISSKNIHINPALSNVIRNSHANYNLDEEINDSFTRNSSPKNNNINSLSLLNQIKIQANIKSIECKFCTSAKRNPLKNLSYQIIYKKYEEKAISILNSNIISDLLFNSKSRIRCIYKDFLIYDCTSELLDKFLLKAQSAKIIQLYGQLTISTFHLGPNYFCLKNERSFLFKNIEKKLKNNLVHEIHNKKKHNKISENETSDNKIFNSTFQKKLEMTQNSPNELEKEKEMEKVKKQENEFQNLIEDFMKEDSIEHSNLNLKALSYINQDFLEEMKPPSQLGEHNEGKLKLLDNHGNLNNNNIINIINNNNSNNQYTGWNNSLNPYPPLSIANTVNFGNSAYVYQRALNLPMPISNQMLSQVQNGTSIYQIPRGGLVSTIQVEPTKDKGLIKGIKYIINPNIVNKKNLKLNLKNDFGDLQKSKPTFSPKALESKQFNFNPSFTQSIPKKNSLSPNVVRNSSLSNLRENGKGILASNIRMNPQNKIQPNKANKKRIQNFPRSLSNLSPFFSTMKISNKLNMNYKIQAQNIRNNMDKRNQNSHKQIARSISSKGKGLRLPRQTTNSLYNCITMDKNKINSNLKTKSRLVISGEKKNVLKSSNKLIHINSN